MSGNNSPGQQSGEHQWKLLERTLESQERQSERVQGYMERHSKRLLMLLSVAFGLQTLLIAGAFGIGMHMDFLGFEGGTEPIAAVATAPEPELEDGGEPLENEPAMVASVEDVFIDDEPIVMSAPPLDEPAPMSLVEPPMMAAITEAPLQPVASGHMLIDPDEIEAQPEAPHEDTP